MRLEPFVALRPPPALAARVLAPPYDVVDRDAARRLAQGHPDSFLHVSRPDIDLADDVDPSAPAVHAQARRALEALVSRGVLRREPGARVYAYRLSSSAGSQTGLVGCVPVADYESGVVATHERTRADKELDRVRHIDAVRAHDEPVLLAVRDEGLLAAELAAMTAAPPETSVEAPDGVLHEVWPVRDSDSLRDVLQGIPKAYVADGHHRSAAAARVLRLRRRRGEPGGEAFLAVVFPARELRVLAYDRVVEPGAGAPDMLLADLRRAGFSVRPERAIPPARPPRHAFVLRLEDRWWSLEAAPGMVDEQDVVARLDVSLLQDRVLGPLLGISDPRSDPRLRFVGGAHGLDLLDAAAGPGSIPIGLHPTSVAEMIECADAGRDLPPKSTWFDPKLGSGLFVHPLD